MSTPESENMANLNGNAVKQPNTKSKVDSSLLQMHEPCYSDDAAQEKGIKPLFDLPKRRWEVWYILVFYVPLLAIPWILTCVQKYRPVNLPSYYNQAGWYTQADFEANMRWQDAVRVFNSAAAVLTIPVTSLLLAQAAVAIIQRRRRTRHTISLAHFFELADRGWTDGKTIWNQIRGNKRVYGRVANRNWWILYSTGFLLLCAGILPLQQLLSSYETILVVTCKDVPFLPGDMKSDACFYAYLSQEDYNAIAQDAEPSTMSIVPLWTTKEAVAAKLVTSGPSEHQQSLWTNWSSIASTGGVSLFKFNQIPEYFDPGPDAYLRDVPFWVSAVANGTTTGVLREHAIRMSYEIKCDDAPMPDPCTGLNPFYTELTWNIPTENPSAVHVEGQNDISIRVCVPGNYLQTPWSMSRDALTIEEDIYLSLYVSDEVKYLTLLDGADVFSNTRNFTTHCSVNTTRGYFELGNYFNDYVPQPLLDKFPSVEEIKGRYNDYAGSYHRNFPYMEPTDHALEDSVHFPYSGFHPAGYAYDHNSLYSAPGPLAIAAVAVFGNESWFNETRRVLELNTIDASTEYCHHSNDIPFTWVDNESFEGSASCGAASSDVDHSLDVAQLRVFSGMLSWFGSFKKPKTARSAFGIAAFYAIEAHLTQATQVWGDTYDIRNIYAGNGHTTQRPSIAPASIIVLSILLALEVLGLVGLAIFITKTPTWTRTIDSLGVAQLATTLDKDILPPAGSANREALQRLHCVPGHVGVEIAKQPGADDKVIQRLVLGSDMPFR